MYRQHSSAHSCDTATHKGEQSTIWYICSDLDSHQKAACTSGTHTYADASTGLAVNVVECKQLPVLSGLLSGKWPLSAARAAPVIGAPSWCDHTVTQASTALVTDMGWNTTHTHEFMLQQNIIQTTLHKARLCFVNSPKCAGATRSKQSACVWAPLRGLTPAAQCRSVLEGLAKAAASQQLHTRCTSWVMDQCTST